MVKTFAGWAGRLVAGYVAFLLVLSLFIGLPKTAAVNHSVVVATFSVIGLVTSGAEDVAPALENGQKVGAKASNADKKS
jgi:hypothetical protein